MFKKLLIIITIFICTGCTNNLEELQPDNQPETELLPDVEIAPEVVLPEQDLPNTFNNYHELLLSYVFIDVINLNRIDLPTNIMNEKITWRNNGSIITTVSGNNNSYYLSASIGNQQRNFNITFKNGIVDEIYQQDLIFKYLYITDTKKLGTSMSANKIIFHNTANSAPALNEVLYLNSIYNTSSVSFHYAVDDIGIYQAVPNNIYAHHAGNLAVNKESIGIEIAKSLSTNNEEKNNAIYNAQKLIRLLQMKYNIDDVLPHYDVTGKHCPHDIFDRYSIDLFYSQIKILHKTIL